MDNITFATLKIGNFCIDIPIEVIEKDKPFSPDCVADISKIKDGVMTEPIVDNEYL